MVLMQHRTDLLHLLREVLLLRFWLRKEEKGKFYFSKCFLFLSIGIAIESTLSVPTILFCHTWARSYPEF